MVREEEGILEVCLPVSNVELFMPVNLTITYQDETAESTLKLNCGVVTDSCRYLTVNIYWRLHILYF